MKRFLLLLAALFVFAGINAQEPKFPFNDPDIPVDQRVEDLLNRLTLEEKVGMMMNGSTGVERLGIPDYNWWNEALHGVARAGTATMFPQAIGMAASFNTELMHKVGEIISIEARAKYNEYKKGKKTIKKRNLTKKNLITKISQIKLQKNLLTLLLKNPKIKRTEKSNLLKINQRKNTTKW